MQCRSPGDIPGAFFIWGNRRTRAGVGKGQPGSGGGGETACEREAERDIYICVPNLQQGI